MRQVTTRWRLLPLIGAVAALAVLAFLFGGNPLTSERATAGGSVLDISGVSCADSYLAQLEAPIADPKPAGTAPGDPPPTTTLFPVAMTISRTVHDTTLATTTSVDPIASVLQTYNLGIPNVIGGELAFGTIPRCAEVGKVVATGLSNPASPTPTGQAITFTVAANPPLVGMIVYWDSSNALQRGFWYVSAAGAGTATIQRTDATCNNTPATNAAAPGTLKACATIAKGIQPFAFLPTNVVNKSLCCAPNLQPRPTAGTFDQATNTSSNTYCTVSTGKQEGAAQSAWTRYSITTVASTDGSKKTPSYTTTQLFNPTTPKTCADIAGQTKRSTLKSVSWSLNSVIDGDGACCALWTSDYDGDTCTNAEELNSPLPSYHAATPNAKGGRDPFNPNDCDRNFNSILNADVQFAPVTLDVGDNHRIPGAFFHCRADIQDVSHNLTTRLFCYTDGYNATANVYIAVNTAATGAIICGAANNLNICGDGLTGSSYPVGTAPPPVPFTFGATAGPGVCTAAAGVVCWASFPAAGTYGDIDSAHNELSNALAGAGTNYYDPATDLIHLEGCYNGIDNGLLGPKAYVRATINALTGNGSASIWLKRTATGVGPCTKAAVDADGPPISPTHPTVPGYAGSIIQITELASKVTVGPVAGNATYDYDLDGCPDKRELGDVANLGGLRDPFNPWDYPDMPIGTNGAKDHQIRIGDVSYVIQHYRHDHGGVIAPLYTTAADRGAGLTGANSWNLTPGDGQIRIGDVSAVIQQYRNDCG